jgi:polysaccharide deacetylase 2 family uncharacterized protein YibQ
MRGERPSALALGFFILFAALALLIVGIGFLGDARDGEPRATLKLSAQASAPAAEVTGTASSASGLVRRVNGQLVADPALLEDVPAGVLPKIAANGLKPMQAYASSAQASSAGRPKIALVIEGLGVSSASTALAATQLPPEVTLAFSPYGTDVQKLVDQARGVGHEVLLHVPMEPLDFPDSDPGPNLLQAGASSDENQKRLAWALGRFTGYVGIANLQGSRFLGEENALEPVLATLTKRGLLFFDDGSNARSVAPKVAATTKTALVKADIVIDSVQSRESIDSQLQELERRARESGSATGSGWIYLLTVQRVTDWAAHLEERGFDLVPLSALAGVPAQASPAQNASAP